MARKQSLRVECLRQASGSTAPCSLLGPRNAGHQLIVSAPGVVAATCTMSVVSQVTEISDVSDHETAAKEESVVKDENSKDEGLVTVTCVDTEDVTLSCAEISVCRPEVSLSCPEISLSYPEVSLKCPDVFQSCPEISLSCAEVTVIFSGVSVSSMCNFVFAYSTNRCLTISFLHFTSVQILCPSTEVNEVL